MNNYIRENNLKSVKLMSVNDKVRKNIALVNFSADFPRISDLRLVDNCLKMTQTAYDVIGGNESKTVILDA